jgi:hypothetical protein
MFIDERIDIANTTSRSDYGGTFLPDGVRCPLSTAVGPPSIDLALLGWMLGEERELVGSCQSRKRGA